MGEKPIQISLEEARKFKALYSTVFEPNIPLQFKTTKKFDEAIGIATDEGIQMMLPGERNTLVVPQAWIPLFEHLKPKEVPVMSMADLSAEEAGRLRAQRGKYLGPYTDCNWKRKRIAQLEKKLGR